MRQALALNHTPHTKKWGYIMKQYFVDNNGEKYTLNIKVSRDVGNLANIGIHAKASIVLSSEQNDYEIIGWYDVNKNFHSFTIFDRKVEKDAPIDVIGTLIKIARTIKV
jgi:hypothetical protein